MNYIKSICESTAKGYMVPVNNIINVCLHPIETYNSICNLAICLIGGDPFTKRLELSSTKGDLFFVKMKKLSKVEKAFNNVLKEVNCNQWVDYDDVHHLNLHDLVQYEAFKDRNFSNHSNLDEFILQTRLNVSFAKSIVEKLTNCPLNQNHFKLIRKIQRLQYRKNQKEIVSFSELCGKNTVKILITKDRLALTQDKEVDRGAFKIAYVGNIILTSEKAAVLEVEICDEKARTKCEREIDILRQLQGKEGIIQLKGAYTKGEKKIIIEEFCNAGSLKNKLGKLTEAEKFDIGLQILKIIKGIHEEGFLYGDLKPHNIFLKRDPESRKLLVRFGDFGGSYKIGTKSLEGSFYNMSPEHLSCAFGIKEQNLNVKTEIFELGLILLELLQAEEYKSQPFPWCEKIDLLFKATNKQKLKDLYEQVEDNMVETINEFQTSINEFSSEMLVEYEVYKIILSMLNVKHPDQRPEIDEVIQLFEKYANYLQENASINHVSTDIIMHIFSFLSEQDLVRMRKVCKKWSVLISVNELELRNIFIPVKKLKSKIDLSSIINWEPKSFQRETRDSSRKLTNNFSFSFNT